MPPACPAELSHLALALHHHDDATGLLGGPPRLLLLDEKLQQINFLTRVLQLRSELHRSLHATRALLPPRRHWYWP
jgi:hypothetical protein